MAARCRRRRPSAGPCSIESEVDSVVAAAEVVALMRALPDQDAYLIACFGDPGMDAARELTDVTGRRHRRGRLPGGDDGGQAVRGHHHAVARHPGDRGRARRARAWGRDASAFSRWASPSPSRAPGYPATTEAIIEAGRRAVAERGADALVLACGGMADVARVVSEAVGVPVCDGVAFGVDARVLAVELRASHQQGRGLRLARADRLRRDARVRRLSGARRRRSASTAVRR